MCLFLTDPPINRVASLRFPFYTTQTRVSQKDTQVSDVPPFSCSSLDSCAHPAAEVLWAETPEGEEAKATPPADQAPSQVMVIIEQLGILAAGVANSRPKESALWYIRPKIGNPAKRRRFPFDFPSKPSHKGAGHEGPEGQQGNAHRAVCTGQILLIFTKNIEVIYYTYM